MLISGVKTPPSHSRHRGMFERAYRGPFRDADESMLRRASMGAQIELVRRRLSGVAFSGGADAAADMYENRFRGPLNEYVREQTEALRGPMLPYSSQRQDPQLYAELTDQLAILPVMFGLSGERARTHRRRLISGQGMYGIVANVLAQELRQRPDGGAEDDEWIGNITELTANAMLNRPQYDDAAALPALPALDEGAKIDLHYHYVDADDHARLHNRQIKVAMPAPEDLDRKTPRIITSAMLGNNPRSGYWAHRGPFQTARAIIAETSSTADHLQVATLDTITNDLLVSLGQSAMFSRCETGLAA